MNHHFVRILIAMTICFAPSIANLHARAVTNLCDAIEDLLDEAKEVCDYDCEELRDRYYELKRTFLKQCKMTFPAPGYGSIWITRPTLECKQMEKDVEALSKFYNHCLSYGFDLQINPAMRDFIERWIMPNILDMCKRDQAGLNQCSEICSEAENYKCALINL